MDGPDRNIREALILGAIRIGHGVNLLPPGLCSSINKAGAR
jgi:hypothetical protein